MPNKKIRPWQKRRWRRAGLLLLVVLVGPYVFSRLASPSRCLTVCTTPDVQVSQTPQPAKQIRIASYNIAHGRGVAASNWDGGDRAARIARLDRIAGLLRKIDADVVVLNEVDFESSWSYSVNQARYLAEKSGYPYWVEQRNLDFRIVNWKWRFGNAILSKTPIANARVVDLPGYSALETILVGKKRGVACNIEVGDQAFQLIGTHLSHRSESLRVRSASVLVDLAAGSPLPTVLAGDLNSTPPGFPKSGSDSNGNNAIATLDEAGWFQRSPANGPPVEKDLTFHSVEPANVIDWILIPRRWHFLQYRVESSHLSDHRAVVADVVPASSEATAVAD